MGCACGQVNTKTKGAAEGARLIEVYHELGGKLPALLAPSRSLLMEVELKLSVRRATRRVHKLVLLSDAILLARPRRTTALRRPLSFRRARSEKPPDGAGAAGAAGAASSKPPLCLQAVLPLAAVSLQSGLTPATRMRRGSAALEPHATAGGGPSGGGAAAASSSRMMRRGSSRADLAMMLQLQCREPEVKTRHRAWGVCASSAAAHVACAPSVHVACTWMCRR